jgi:hypothetical protein
MFQKRKGVSKANYITKGKLKGGIATQQKPPKQPPTS